MRRDTPSTWRRYTTPGPLVIPFPLDGVWRERGDRLSDRIKAADAASGVNGKFKGDD